MAGYKDKHWVVPLDRSKFYVYALYDENGFPFYIGKGKNNRVNNHIKPSLRKERCYKNHKINSLLKKTGYVRREILAYFDSEEDAYNMEEYLIGFYGFRISGGCLTNVRSHRNDFPVKACKKKNICLKKKRNEHIPDSLILSLYDEWVGNYVPIDVLAAREGIDKRYLHAIFSGKERKDLGLSKDVKSYSFKGKTCKNLIIDISRDRDLGLSYKQLVEKYGVSKTNISRICKRVGCYDFLNHIDIWDDSNYWVPVSPTGRGTAKSPVSSDTSTANKEN